LGEGPPWTGSLVSRNGALLASNRGLMDFWTDIAETTSVPDHDHFTIDFLRKSTVLQHTERAPEWVAGLTA
jgi:hypothetical protein